MRAKNGQWWKKIPSMGQFSTCKEKGKLEHYFIYIFYINTIYYTIIKYIDFFFFFVYIHGVSKYNNLCMYTRDRERHASFV